MRRDIMTKKISHMVIMGDSLSDRGTADEAYVLGCIPMSWLSGLSGTSPQGRFTNGYVWADGISSMFASDFMIKEIKKQGNYDTHANEDISSILSRNKPLLSALKSRYASDDISDAILSKDKHIFDYLRNGTISSNDDIGDAIIAKNKKISDQLKCDYSLDNDRVVKYEGRDFIRSYNEGGLTSYDYSWVPSISITRFFSRIILSTLAEKRKQCLDYDEEHQVSRKQKAQTLVIEWSGANDLITVNARPSMSEVDKAIKERVKNMEILIKKGYRNFALFNLPDLSLTPRFQNMTGAEGEQERANAKQCSTYFNEQLAQACEKLQLMYPHYSIDVFDVNSIFTDACTDPEKYGFDSSKLHQPYKTSVDFEMQSNQTSPSVGYMFWDDVHPTADMQAVLASKFYDKYNPKYEFTKPEDEIVYEKDAQITEAQLCAAFCARYGDKLAKDQQGFFSQFKKSHIKHHTANLEEIFRHAFCENGTRTKEVLSELQWIDEEGKINMNNRAIKEAFNGAKMSEFWMKHA